MSTPDSTSLAQSLVDAAARAIRDEYERLPDGAAPEFTEVAEWHGEARAAAYEVLRALALEFSDVGQRSIKLPTVVNRLVELARDIREGR